MAMECWGVDGGGWVGVGSLGSLWLLLCWIWGYKCKMGGEGKGSVTQRRGVELRGDERKEEPGDEGRIVAKVLPEQRPSCTGCQVAQVRRPRGRTRGNVPNLGVSIAKLVRLDYMPELEDGVLLRAARVIDREIDHEPLAPEEPAAAAAELDRLEQIRPLEDVQSPGVPRRRLARLGRLVVLEHNVPDRVGLCR